MLNLLIWLSSFMEKLCRVDLTPNYPSANNEKVKRHIKSYNDDNSGVLQKESKVSLTCVYFLLVCSVSAAVP